MIRLLVLKEDSIRYKGDTFMYPNVEWEIHRITRLNLQRFELPTYLRCTSYDICGKTKEKMVNCHFDFQCIYFHVLPKEHQ